MTMSKLTGTIMAYSVLQAHTWETRWYDYAEHVLRVTQHPEQAEHTCGAVYGHSPNLIDSWLLQKYDQCTHSS